MSDLFDLSNDLILLGQIDNTLAIKDSSILYSKYIFIETFFLNS